MPKQMMVFLILLFITENISIKQKIITIIKKTVKITILDSATVATSEAIDPIKIRFFSFLFNEITPSSSVCNVKEH